MIMIALYRQYLLVNSYLHLTAYADNWAQAIFVEDLMTKFGP